MIVNVLVQSLNEGFIVITVVVSGIMSEEYRGINNLCDKLEANGFIRSV